MKNKLFFTILGLSIFAGFVYAGYEDPFIDALKTCSHYTKTGNIETEGMQIDVKEEIAGFEKDRCVYKEFLDMAGAKSCITCRFTKSQIGELVKVMEAYNTLQSYSEEKPDTSSVEAVQDNPVVKVWNKYLNDSSVCTIGMPK